MKVILNFGVKVIINFCTTEKIKVTLCITKNLTH